MTRLHAPAAGRRAAVLTLGAVGGAVLVLASVLIGWQDALTVTAWNHSWPALTTSAVLGIGMRWSASVTVWCAVCWVCVVASGRAARRRILAAAVGVVVGWTVLGALDTWWLPWWPGPVAPTYMVPADRPTGLELVPDPSVVGPGALMPLVLLAAVVATCLSAARQPGWPVRSRSSWQGWTLASLVLGLPAASIAAVSLYVAIDTGDGTTLRDGITYALVDPGRALFVAMVTAALLAGRMPGGTLVALGVGLHATVPGALAWLGGGADRLLATAAAGALAIAMAGCIGPAAAALTRLDDGATGEGTDFRPTSSVPEGADADDRTRA